MKYFFSFSISFLLLAYNCFSQKSFSIIYSFKNIDTFYNQWNQFKKKYDDAPKYRMLFNDSLIYSFYIGDIPYAFEKKTVFGKSLHHSAFYYNKNQDKIYKVDFHLPRKKCVFTDYRIIRTWAKYHENKQILGYDCESVFMSSNKNDTTIVFFTKQFNTNAAPFNGYFDIPGVVLEIIDNRYKNHTKAIRVIEKEYKIFMPKSEILTEEERNQYLKKHH